MPGATAQRSGEAPRNRKCEFWRPRPLQSLNHLLPKARKGLASSEHVAVFDSAWLQKYLWAEQVNRWKKEKHGYVDSLCPAFTAGRAPSFVKGIISLSRLCARLSPVPEPRRTRRHLPPHSWAFHRWRSLRAGPGPAGAAPLREPGPGPAAAPGTWAIHSPLLLWISCLLPDPPPPLPLHLLHSSGVKGIQKKGGNPPNDIFSDEQNPGASKGKRAWTLGLCWHLCAWGSGWQRLLRRDKVGHWTPGILRATKSPRPTLGPLITYLKKKMLRQTGEIFLRRVSLPCWRPVEHDIDQNPGRLPHL